MVLTNLPRVDVFDQPFSSQKAPGSPNSVMQIACLRHARQAVKARRGIIAEIVIFADDTSDPETIAWDLMAQSEHDSDASAVLISSSDKLIDEVKKIINKDETMAIRIDVTSSLVTVDAMKNALIEGLEKSTGNNTVPLMKEINQLTSTFNSDVSTGDFYEFIFLPDTGTNVLKNSVYIDTIPGIEFKKAFFGIWLSDTPIQKNLKKALLGG